MTKTGQALYVAVAAQIEDRIIRGEWVASQRIPALTELAVFFGVSRAVVREACSLLVGSGLLELRHGDGTYVRTIALDTFTRPVHAALLLGASQVGSLFEVGSWLESGIAQVAATRRTDEHCARLAEALFVMETGTLDEDGLLVAEQSFHLLLAEASGNEVAANLLRVLYHPLTSILRLLVSDGDTRNWIVAMHRTMYDSVVQMDGGAAQRVMGMYRSSLQDRAREM